MAPKHKRRKYAIVLHATRTVSRGMPTIFEKAGPGEGNRRTSDFMENLRKEVRNRLADDVIPEHALMDDCVAKVDFWIPSVEAVVEIGFGLRNPNREFERDMLKVLIARERGRVWLG